MDSQHEDIPFVVGRSLCALSRACWTSVVFAKSLFTVIYDLSPDKVIFVNI
jgi:hypothetical protein